MCNMCVVNRIKRQLQGEIMDTVGQRPHLATYK